MRNAEVAHLWFHAGERARLRRVPTLFFEGDTVYSYGHHYPLARKVQVPKHPLFVLLNRYRLSVTTKQHQALVRQAIPSHTRVIEVQNPMARTKAAHRENYRELKFTLELTSIEMIRARSRKLSLFEKCQQVVAHLNFYTKVFKLGFRQIPMPSVDGLQELFKKEAAAQKRRERQERKRRQKDFDEKLFPWHRGDRVNLPPSIGNFAYLRVDPGDSEVIETSLGASVPKKHVVKAWPLIKRCYKSGEGFEPKDRTIHLGSYALDRIGKNGTIYIGCHTITKKEILRFAKILNLA